MVDRELFPAVGAEGRLVDRVVNELQSLIVAGRLAPGTRLPPERDLAAQLAVSRTVTREAVHILVTKGLLVTRQGVGTTVRQVTSGQVTEPLRLLLQSQGHTIAIDQLHQVRSILEVAIAELAAAQANAGDLATLQQLLREMEEVQGDPAEFAARDAGYHQALAVATHNPLLVILLDSIRDLMAEVRRMVASQPGLPQLVMPQHRRILERVAARDARGARRAMQEHLEQARRIQQTALQA